MAWSAAMAAASCSCSVSGKDGGSSLEQKLPKKTNSRVLGVALHLAVPVSPG